MQRRRRRERAPERAAMLSAGAAALRAAGIGTTAGAPALSDFFASGGAGGAATWRRRGIGVAAAFVLLAGVGDAAPSRRAAAPPGAPAIVRDPSVAAPAEAASATAVPEPDWGASLRAVHVTNGNTNAQADVRLYSDHGSLELGALREFMRVAATVPDAPDQDNGEVAEPLDSRLVQLAFRAAYHFDAAPIVLISALRKGAHGKHASGEALDFKLDGVPPAQLAAYVRSFPRAGIGIYTHPKTQYVHVDVRERSYQWVDGSPPGVTWREQLLSDPKQEERDASYVSALDLPEAADESR